MSTVPTYKVLVEATKLMEPDGDGVKRYVVELLTAFTQLPPSMQQCWEIDLYIYGDIVPLKHYLTELRIEVAQRKYGLLGYETYLLRFKSWMQRLLPKPVYNLLAPLYRNLPFRWLLQRIKKAGKSLQRWWRPVHKDPRFAAYDLIHLPLPQHEDPFQGLDIPIVATIHDLTDMRFPEWHQARNLRLARRGMAFLLKQEAHLIAVSAATQTDIVSYYNVPPERVTVVYEAANPAHFQPTHTDDARQAVRFRYGMGDTPYLLTLSTIEPRKNLLRTIQAFQQMKAAHPKVRVKLVIAGKYGWKSKGLYKGVDLERDDILFTGFVEEADLPVVYAEALALCYVSLYEGFGLPPLEAMLCGTPVIYADRSSLPEVVGKGGIPVDPTAVGEISAAMYQMASHTDEREMLTEQALQEAKRFSWQQCATATLAVYERAISAAKN